MRITIVVWLKNGVLSASLNGARPDTNDAAEDILSVANNGVVGRNANLNYGNFKIKRWACAKVCPADPQQLGADLVTAYGL